jgi:hypothetical protein
VASEHGGFRHATWLRAAHSEAGGWSSFSIETGEVRGFDDKSAQMLFVAARKHL